MPDKNIPAHLLKALSERQQKGMLRRLSYDVPKIDFCSNDYLGFSRTGLLSEKMRNTRLTSDAYGATGSRLVSGNSAFVEEAEKQIAMFHHGKSALIFNSGYDANLGLLSSVPQKEDLILYDELVHASIHDGIRLGFATHYKFRHNDLEHLRTLLARHQHLFRSIFIVVESVYSMDGDSAALLEIVEMIRKLENVYLIVDEAHAIGVFGRQGRGLCSSLGIEQQCFARIYTYGKAMGCHGAAVVGSDMLRNYLINFARSFIYTTALPIHAVDAILTAYQLLIETDRQEALQDNIAYFYSKTSGIPQMIRSQSAVHAFLVSGNAEADRLEALLKSRDIHAKCIKSPTVKEGTERIRFSLHAYNTKAEIDQLVDAIQAYRI